MKKAWLLACGLAVGCSGPDTSWMPLKVGKSWTYTVNASNVTTIAEFKAARTIAVGSTQGVEIQSKVGKSRFGWDGDRLIASTLGQSEVSPPLPFLALGQKSVRWHGFVKSLGVAEEADATLLMNEPALDPQKRRLLRTQLEVVFPGRGGRPARTLVVETWFQRGVGIVKQTHRTATSSTSDLDVAITLVGR